MINSLYRLKIVNLLHKTHALVNFAAMFTEIKYMYDILASFLGDARNEPDGSNYELEFPCPRCIEEKGPGEAMKHNLAVNLKKQKFHCWSCGQVHEDMQGSVVKLIKMFGTSRHLEDYRRIVKEFRESELYHLNFDEGDFDITTQKEEKSELEIPGGYHPFRKNRHNPEKALNYLFNRGIGWDIIERFNIGYTDYDNEIPQLRERIIIPSYDTYGYLNYWTGRYYGRYAKAQKYYNPKADRKTIIFNEEKLQWDADITLVEGPFDHLVVPNSVPMLGKALNDGFKLFWNLITRAKSKVNVFLDGDAMEDAVKVYRALNHDTLMGRVRLVTPIGNMDPSEIYQKYGYKGIAACLRDSRELTEEELVSYDL